MKTCCEKVAPVAGSGGGCGGLRGLEIDLVAQVLKAPDEAALETFAATQPA